MEKKTGFHNKTSELGAKYLDMYGYAIPQNYKTSTVEDEYKNVRENVGVIDLSYLPKIEILGPDAETLCQTIFTRDIKRMGHKGVVYTAILNEDGGMVDDGTLFRLCQNTFRFVCGYEETIDYIRGVAEKMGLKITIKDSTDYYSNIAIQGPNSRKLLEKIIWTAATDPDLKDIEAFTFAPARLHYDNGTAIVVSRTGYSGELGYEIWVGPKFAELVWNAVFEAGEEFGVKPFGLDALDLLRVEAGLIFAGYEFDTETDPNEAGIRYVAPLKKQVDNFIGRQALEKRIQKPKKNLIGVELEGEVASGDEITIAGKKIGAITSPIFSPMMNKHIAMAFVEPDHNKIGNEFEVGKVKAKVVEFPFYDPTRSRMRG